LWKAQDFTDRLRSMRIRKGAKARRDDLLASIDEAAFRMTLKAKTLEERMRIEDERAALTEQVYEAFYGADDEGDGEPHFDFEEPDLPDAWVIMAANPSKDQLNFKI
jgi:hypothetical protein